MSKYWPIHERIEVRTIAQTNGAAAAGQSAPSPSLRARLECFDRKVHRVSIHRSVEMSRGFPVGTGRPLRAYGSDWFPESRTVWVVFTPGDATSIMAVDPATMPAFK